MGAGGPLRTPACLRLTGRAYPPTRWWETAATGSSASDRAFASVLTAIKQQDREALVKLTDPAQARDPARFDQQANAFFQQFQSIRLVEVPRAYELDGLVVYFGKFQSATQTAFVPLAFQRESQDAFGFLPSRSSSLTFKLVNEWFVPSSSAPAEPPPYCADADVTRATHRVSLAPSAWRPSALLLTGAPLDAPGQPAPVAARVRSTLDRIRMKKALGGPDVDGFLAYLTPMGGERLREWFATSPPAESWPVQGGVHRATAVLRPRRVAVARGLRPDPYR